MTTATATQRSASASRSSFRTFALVFGIAVPLLYTMFEIMNLPLFTYHPGTNRVDFGFAPAVTDEGPAMYWYGWIVSTFVGAGIVAGLATLLPESVSKKIPLSLTWVTPLAVLPVLIYSLKFFWRW